MFLASTQSYQSLRFRGAGSNLPRAQPLETAAPQLSHFRFQKPFCDESAPSLRRAHRHRLVRWLFERARVGS
jgi:hypothetical protein